MSSPRTKEQLLAEEFGIPIPPSIVKTEASSKQKSYTDIQNAAYFATRNKDTVLYDNKRNRWLVWDGHYWKSDTSGSVVWTAMEMTQKMINESASDPEHGKETYARARTLQNKNKLMAMVSLAKHLPDLQTDGEDFDKNPFFLGVANGVLDLTTGVLRNGKPSDLISMHSDILYDPNALCPRWEQFMEEVFGSDELITYMQKCLGYILTGSVTEQIFFMGYGNGQNGKNILVEALAHAMGDYACSATSLTFKKNEWKTQTNDIAGFDRKRFIYYTEASASSLNEELLKSLSSGDKQKVRFLNQEFFEFEPIGKIWLMFNEKPRTTDDSFGFWRRIRFIPFTRQFSDRERDIHLKEKLQAEAPGILTWLVDGCRMWQETGLNPTPEVFNEALYEYKQENDRLADFISEACEVGVDYEIQASAFFAHYELWANKNHILIADRFNRTSFGIAMKRKFTTKVIDSRNKTKAYVGITNKYL